MWAKAQNAWRHTRMRLRSPRQAWASAGENWGEIGRRGMRAGSKSGTHEGRGLTGLPELRLAIQQEECELHEALRGCAAARRSHKARCSNASRVFFAHNTSSANMSERSALLITPERLQGNWEESHERGGGRWRACVMWSQPLALCCTACSSAWRTGVAPACDGSCGAQTLTLRRCSSAKSALSALITKLRASFCSQEMRASEKTSAWVQKRHGDQLHCQKLWAVALGPTRAQCRVLCPGAAPG